MSVYHLFHKYSNALMPSDKRVIEHKNSLETSVLNVTNKDTEILKKKSRYKQSQSRKSSPNI